MANQNATFLWLLEAEPAILVEFIEPKFIITPIRL